MGYPVAAVRGHWTVSSGATSWWLSGGISAANCIAAYQPKGAASLAASYVNLANPGTYNAAPGIAPTWDSTNGWIFDSTDNLLTGITPASTWSMFVRYSNAATDYSRAIGETASNAAFVVGLRETSTNVLWYWAGGNKSSNVSDSTSGIQALCGNTCYFNATSYGTISGTFSGTPTAIIIRLNSNKNFYIQAMSIYDITLSTQVAALNTAMAAL